MQGCESNIDETTKHRDITILFEIVDDGADSAVGNLFVGLHWAFFLSINANGHDEACASSQSDEVHDEIRP